MDSTPANYADPTPSPDLMGWGEPTANLLEKFRGERATIERIENKGLIVGAAAAQGATAILPKIEAKLRARMKFDEGWDFMVAERLVYGFGDDETLMVPQNIGNCVGNSHACLLAARIAHEVYAIGEAETALGKGKAGIPFIAYSYGAGRLAGNMLGPGDGSYCGAQIEGSQEYGFLPLDTPGLSEAYTDLPQGTAGTGRLFGRSKAEIMKWADKAKLYDLVEAPQCKSADDAIELVVNKKVPLQICSGWGFRYKGFDSTYGVHLYAPGGSWSHSMQVIAVFKIKGQWFVTIRNQWGYDAHRGSPEIGMPGGTYVITIETFAKWVRDSETIGIGAIKGRIAAPPL